MKCVHLINANVKTHDKTAEGRSEEEHGSAVLLFLKVFFEIYFLNSRSTFSHGKSQSFLPK